MEKLRVEHEARSIVINQSGAYQDVCTDILDWLQHDTTIAYDEDHYVTDSQDAVDYYDNALDTFHAADCLAAEGEIDTAHWSYYDNDDLDQSLANIQREIKNHQQDNGGH